MEVKLADFFIRTEDIKSEEILDLFVESKGDRQVINALKGRNPIILLGSRGVGKSFLLRVAQAELLRDFENDRIFPIYVSFTKSSLVQANATDRFHQWMLARVCSAIIRGVAKAGLLALAPKSISVLAGGSIKEELPETEIEKIAIAFEDGWKNPSGKVDVSVLPDVDELKDAIEDICLQLKIERLVVFIDEAAHIFLPEQQRQFFTFFRDMRNPYLTCNAAVYPGVTSFGATFQPVHDATVMSVDRDISDPLYVQNMREIVERQADSTILQNIQKNGQNFAVLAYAATGNPRVLLKTLNKTPKLNSSEINEVVRSYYRSDAWAEHSLLSEKYAGHRGLIDWGRSFIENEVLPEIKLKNDQYVKTDKKTSAFFWVHRDAPRAVEQALRVLSYTGLVIEHSQGIKATRAEIGTRYLVNLGCLFALESSPASSSFAIAKDLTIKRMTEYGAHHPAFELLNSTEATLENAQVGNQALQAQLAKDISVLDITEWQELTLRGLGISTVGDVLNATETALKKAYYVGDVRSRRMRNAAVAAVYEYLSG
jgi:hypothetical protein